MCNFKLVIVSKAVVMCKTKITHKYFIMSLPPLGTGGGIMLLRTSVRPSIHKKFPIQMKFGV